MNFVHIVGRLGKDPETRFTADGKKITTLVIATSYKKGSVEETIWWRATLWGDRWDNMITHFAKGKSIMVGGEMRKPELYVDKNGVSQLSSIEITADYVKFVPFTKQESSDQEMASSNTGFAQKNSAQQQRFQPQDTGGFGHSPQGHQNQGQKPFGQAQEFHAMDIDDELPF